MPLLRWPGEVLGTAAGNDQFSGATSTVYFGRMGDDVFFAQPGVPPPEADPGDPLFIGGSGNDTYVLANSSEVIVAEYGSSVSDVLVATGMGINRTTTFVFTIDNRHLAAADTQTGQSVFVLDWQLAANRIETIVLADGTFSFAQIQAAVFSSPNFLGNFTWEFLDLGYSTADVNEAISFYTARATLIDSKRPPVVAPTSANFSVLHDQSAAASTLFSVSDPDGDSITVYDFFDSGAGAGAFTLNGAPQAANQILTVQAANLPTVAYRAGTLQAAEAVHVRAYDGVDWSAWTPWTMTSFNSVPVVTPAANTLVTTGQAVALSSLFGFVDADGDALNTMNLYDAGAGGGFLRINGVAQPALTLITITAGQLAQTEYVGGVTPTALPVSELLWASATDGTNNLSAWVNLTMNSRRGSNANPVVNAPARNMDQNQWRQLSELITVSDADGDPVQQYEITDSTGGAGSAYFYANGVTQAQGATALVNAADLANTWVNGGSDIALNGFSIRATDGYAAGTWSAPASLNLTTRAQPNRAPVVSAPNGARQVGQAAGVGSLVGFSDADGDPVWSYEFYDAGVGGGNFRIGAAAQPALTIIPVSAAQLASTQYVAGASPGSETLWVHGYDGQAWSAWTSWQMFSQPAGANALPVVNAPNRNIDQNQWRQLSELITVSDAEGNPINQYQITDSTGGAGSAYFYANGVTQAQGATALVNAADLANTWVNGGSDVALNGFSIRAFDTFGWSAPTSLNLNTRAQPNRAPVVSAPNSALQVGQAAGVGSLVGFSDADGDPVWSYEFYDAGVGGGNFRIGAAAQPALTIIPVSAAQLASTQYVAGASPGSETLWVHGYDGQAWSAWTSWQMFSQPAGANALPVVNAPNRNIDQNQWRQLSELITVSDAEGNPINQYQITDSTGGAGSAYFYANGVTQAQGATALVNAADLANTWVNGGSDVALNGFSIRAFDTFGWSAPTSLNLNTRAQPNRAPTVTPTAANQTVPIGQAVAASSLWGFTDADGDAPFSFELYDAGAGGGQFQIGAATQPALTVIPVTAAQLASVQYVGGAARGGETLWVHGYDGQAWSAWVSWTMQTVRITNANPTVSVPNQVVGIGVWTQFSTFVMTADADGDAIALFEIHDFTATAGSGYLYANGVEQPQGATVSVASLAATWVRGGASPITDNYEIRARDSEGGWSAWTPFNVRASNPPQVTAYESGVALGQAVSLGELFTATDPDGNPISKYELYDTGAGAGYFRINGAQQPSSQIIAVSPAQLAQTDYFGAAAGGETLYIRAYDGTLASAWTGFAMSALADPLRFPEVLGTSGGDAFAAEPVDKVFFGLGGDDSFQTSLGAGAVFVGGPGNDSYWVTSNGSIDFVYESGSSTSDSLLMLGWAPFENPIASAGIIEGRHLFLQNAPPFAEAGIAIILDWQLPQNRIETWRSVGGATDYTYDEFVTNLGSLPALTWGDVFFDAAYVSEAVRFYEQRAAQLAT